MIGVIRLNSQRYFVVKSNTKITSRFACNSTTTHQLLNDSPEKKIVNSQKYCIEHVKKYDRENYLAAIFIKDPSTRRAVFALRAFNVELSLIRDLTTNSDRAKLRLHFWSKLVEEIERRNDEVDTNIDKLKAYYNYTPIAKELLELFNLIDMDEKIKACVRNLIGSRVSSKVLGYKQFETMQEIEAYCSKANASVYHLSANIAPQLHNIRVNEYIKSSISLVAEDVGVAHGLSNIIRGIPYNSTKNCCYIPKDLLEKYYLTNRDFLNNRLDGNKIRGVVEALAIRCQELIDESYSEIHALPNFYRQILLPRVSIQVNLWRLKKCNYNICDPRLGQKNGLLALNLWMASKFYRAPIF